MQIRRFGLGTAEVLFSGLNQLLGSDQAIAVNAEENTLNLLLHAVYDKEVKVEADDAQKLEALAVELDVENDLKRVGQSKPIVPPVSTAIIETADGKFQCILCGGTHNQRGNAVSKSTKASPGVVFQ
jgi:hypothetical protein